jgi:hypothetical protein
MHQRRELAGNPLEERGLREVYRGEETAWVSVRRQRHPYKHAGRAQNEPADEQPETGATYQVCDNTEVSEILSRWWFLGFI